MAQSIRVVPNDNLCKDVDQEDATNTTLGANPEKQCTLGETTVLATPPHNTFRKGVASTRTPTERMCQE